MNQQTRRRAAAGVIPESIADNEDVLTEILERLPVKSTIRFKSVCTNWLNLLSDSQFATNYSTRNHTKPSSISGFYLHIGETFDRASSFSLDGRQGNLPPLSFLDGLEGGSRVRVRVMHSSNGLLLCRFQPIEEGDVSEGHQKYLLFLGQSEKNQKYLVCNPTTKKYRLLPQPVGLRRRTDGYLIFDPTKSSLHYKVVLLSCNPFLVDVYSSQSLCWKEFYPDQEYSGHSVFWNGAIHLLNNDDILRKFDVDVEKIIAVPNPRSPQVLRSQDIMYFGECGGGLILIQSSSWHPSKFLILELKKDYSCWVIKCRADLSPLIAEFRKKKTRIRYKVLGAVEGENERGFALLLGTPSRIISYDLKSMTWDALRRLSVVESRVFGSRSSALPFVETLFPV